MSNQWEVYFTHIENKQSAVRVDLGIYEEVPINNFSRLAILKLETKSLFSKKLNFNLIGLLEDEIDNAIIASDYFVGVITEAETRRMYIYTKDEEVLQNNLLRILRNHKKVRHELTFVEDTNWNFYKDTLYPNFIEKQWILDREVVDQLKGHGDLHHIPREVNHWVYFKDEEKREQFKKVVSQEGFDVIDERLLEEDSPHPYQLTLSNISAVNLISINIITTALLKRAIEYDGDYDGWETKIINDQME
jgi:regulator of RNase E activity RraB